MRFTIYRTTNTINGRYYVGMHKTADPDDSYLGSGSLLLNAIAKYGRCAFLKEVLFDFDTPEEMEAKEAEIVDESFINDPTTYNLNLGGTGGWDHVNRRLAEARRDPAWVSPNLGLTHSPETLAHLKSLLWVRRGGESRKILLEDLPVYMTEGWEQGRPEAISERMQGNSSHEGSVWVHCGDDERLVPADKIPGGWVRGRPSLHGNTQGATAFLGRTHSKATREKISQALRDSGFKPVRQDGFKGKTHAAEAREKLRQANLGRTHSNQSKSKIGASKIGRKRVHNPSTGQKRYINPADRDALLGEGWLRGWPR